MEATRRLYRPASGANELKALGLPGELAGSFEEAPCEILPQNWTTVQLFIAMATQWRIGHNGPTGLDYAALPMEALSEGVRLTQKRLWGIRIMEGEALKCIAEQRAT